MLDEGQLLHYMRAISTETVRGKTETNYDYYCVALVRGQAVQLQLIAIDLMKY